jgi:hypothetical protein
MLATKHKKHPHTRTKANIDNILFGAYKAFIDASEVLALALVVVVVLELELEEDKRDDVLVLLNAY